MLNRLGKANELSDLKMRKMKIMSENKNSVFVWKRGSTRVLVCTECKDRMTCVLYV